MKDMRSRSTQKFAPYFLFCICLSAHRLFAQEQDNLRPGVIYEAGDELYAPNYGIRGEVPLGWQGGLPRDTELFLLLPAHVTTDIQIYTFAIEDDLANIKQRWQKPIEISYGILAQPKDMPEEKEGILTQNFTFSNRPDYKAIGNVQCGEYGTCVVSFLTGKLDQMPKAQNSLQEFMQSISFEKPNPKAAVEPFDWQEFLPDKHIFTYYAMRGNPNKNNLYLCPDGTFTTDISRKGMVEALDQYAGKQKGTYKLTAKDDGSAELSLSFKKKKLLPITVSLMMEDNKLYMNEERVMAVLNTQCK